MLNGGFFNRGGTGGSSGGSQRVQIRNGNVYASPMMDFYVDNDGNVFANSENNNAKMMMEDNNVFARKVV